MLENILIPSETKNYIKFPEINGVESFVELRKKKWNDEKILF